MNETDLHNMVASRLDAIEQTLQGMAGDLGALKAKMHLPATCSLGSSISSLESAVKTLEREQDQARGGVRTGLAVVALFAAITGGVAALIAIFRN